MEEKYIESMKKIHNKHYEFLEKFREIAKIEKIEYGVIGGAAIGALREKDFLEGDDDLDLIVREENIDHFRSIEGEKYGGSLKNDIKTPHSNIDKLYILDTKVEINGYDDYLFVDIFTGYKERKISRLKRMKLIIIDYIGYIKTYSYKEIAKEYGQLWRIVKSLFTLIPGTQKYYKNRGNRTLINSKITSNSRRKFYFVFDAKIKNKEHHLLLKGNDHGKIRDMIVPVPFKMRETTRTFYGDIMIKPKQIPQKPDHDIFMKK